MKKLPIAVFSLAVVLVNGCVIERSLTTDSARTHIGSRFRTTQPFFLAKAGTRYLLVDERGQDIPTSQAPTFEEFRQGQWRNRTFAARKFLRILPRGSVIEITDIVRQVHVEMGASYLCYGRIAGDPAFADFGRVDLSFLFQDRLHPSRMRGGEKTND